MRYWMGRLWDWAKAAFLIVFVVAVVCVLVTGAVFGLRAEGVWGYSQKVQNSDYLEEVGLNDQPYELLRSPDLSPGVEGSLAGSGGFFLGIGGFSVNGHIASVDSVRMAVRVNDQVFILNIPVSKIAWEVKNGVNTPTVTFLLKKDGKYDLLYRINRPGETIWEPNPYNEDKQEAITKFSGGFGSLINEFVIKATVTVDPEVFRTQVLPLQAAVPAQK